MPKPLPTLTPPSRYSYRRVADEIGAEIDHRDEIGLQKTVAGATGLDESAFSHRLTGDKSKFTIEQIGCIADALKMPPGWPFIPVERKARARKRSR